MVKVGFQGQHGTYSEIAVNNYFANTDIEKISYKNFISIIDDLENGVIDYGMFPVENTTTGIISRTYDFFKDHKLFAVGEINVFISEDLAVIPNTKLEDIKEVYSHPEALSQCQSFFNEHPNIQAIAYQDTAKSMEYIKETNDKSKAALGSYLGAQYYELEIILKDVNDNKNNVTRFLVVKKNEEVSKDADKISVVFTLKHEAGTLYNILKILNDYGINILKLESRPIVGKLFEYCFYMDFDGNILDDNTKEAIKEIDAHTLSFKVLGCYPRDKMK